MNIDEPRDDTLSGSAWTLATWLKLGLLPFAMSSVLPGGQFLGDDSIDFSGSDDTASMTVVETWVSEWDLAQALARIHGDLTRNAIRADAELGDLIDKHLFELYVRH